MKTKAGSSKRPQKINTHSNKIDLREDILQAPVTLSRRSWSPCAGEEKCKQNMWAWERGKMIARWNGGPLRRKKGENLYFRSFLYHP
jgi:hypothetical protein